MDTATDILNRLKPEEIVAKLEQMDAEAKALRVLLRAARQRERQRNRPEPAAVEDAIARRAAQANQEGKS